MSTQEVLDKVIRERMTDEEVRDALLDISLLLSDTQREPKETVKMLVDIYRKRIFKHTD